MAVFKGQQTVEMCLNTDLLEGVSNNYFTTLEAHSFHTSVHGKCDISMKLCQ